MTLKKIFNYGLAVAGFFAASYISKKAPLPTSLQQTFDKQGHRGCRGLMPENTWPAMRRALDLGVTTLEMDVLISKDRKVVLSHDPFFSHEISTRPDGSYVTESEEQSLKLYNMNYTDIRKYDVGMKPYPRFPRQEKIRAIKPLLSDLLDSVQAYMVTSKRAMPYFNIEIKSTPETDNIDHPAPPVFAELVMDVIREKGVMDRVIIQSFDFRPLQYLHARYPAVKTSLLIDGSDRRGLDEQLKILGYTPPVYSPAYQLVNSALVAQCHSKNIRIVPWTVNEKEQIEELKKMGVDGLISDYPDLF